jgi:molecular chaperone GrpE
MVEEKDINLNNESQEVIDGKRDTSSDQVEVEEKVNESEKESKNIFSKGKKAAKKHEEKIAALENQLNELNDKYLRLFSEFDNYRKRTNKERLDLLKTASEDTIISLLPVLDDFERAMAAMEKNGVTGVDVEGIRLIYNKLLGILTKKGLEPMNTKGQPFDTDYHEALTTIPAPEEEMKGKVIDEIEKGYLLGGKVIRFARVVVGQ